MHILPVMKRTLRITAAVIGIFFAILLIAAATFFFYYLGVTANTKLDPAKLIPESAFVRLYDQTGEEMPVSALTYTTEIPEHVKNAFVAIEDKRFYTHRGVDVKRIASALWHNLTSLSFAEGASTITQQLIKNTHLSSEKTISRKLKEIKLARQLEKKYSKDEILTLYLNSIYFGHSAFGIEDAARFYFGKGTEALTVAEGAMLAAIVKSPNRYSPFRNADDCKARRDLVLRCMKEQGYLDEESCQSAIGEALPVTPCAAATESTYVDSVFDELARLFPDAKSGDWGMLHVYTYCDKKLQEKLQQIQCDTDVCLVVRDNAANAIRALHASAGVLKRLPASTIKPLLVYAPAIEENLVSAATPLLDKKTDFGGYSPDDYNGATGEYMSVRHALAYSVNIPAVRVLNEMGVETGARYLARMGLHVPDEDKSLALALGGMREGFTLPALADGFATFAGGGIYAPSGLIARVEDDKGRVLYSNSPAGQRVFSEDVCCIMNDMLQTAVREGTAKKLRALPYPVCAKTGTAGTESGNTDAYCVAYTRDHVVAAWMGNADNSPIEVTGGGLPANAVLTVMRSLYPSGAPTPFEESGDVVRLHFDRASYENEHAILLADPAAPPATSLSELFRASAAPTAISTRFSMPSIRTPTLQLENGTVKIILSRTEYYEYEIKRENRGEITTIYSGPYRNIICDNSVRAGESYVYTVTPRYQHFTGTPVALPSVTLPGSAALPDDWWLDQ